MRAHLPVLERHLKWWCVLSLVLLLCFFSTRSLFAADGDLDQTLDENGVKVDTALNNGGNYHGFSTVVLEDGAIVVAVFAVGGGFGLQSYLAPYSPEGEFLGDPAQLTRFNGAQINDMVLLPDGNILAVGFRVNGLQQDQLRDFFHVLLTPVVTPQGVNFEIQNPNDNMTALFNGSDDEALTVAMTGDNQYIVAGYSTFGGRENIAWIRLNEEMEVDTSIGDDGVVATPLEAIGAPGNARLLDVLVQPDGEVADGRIVGVGFGTEEDGKMTPLALRYLPDGTLDESFADDGIYYNLNTTLTRSVAVAYYQHPTRIGASLLLLTEGPTTAGANQELHLFAIELSDGSSSYPGPTTVHLNFPRLYDTGKAMKVVSPRQVLIAASTSESTDGSTPSDTGLARVEFPVDPSAPPVLDTAFGENGMMTLDLADVEGESGPDEIVALAQQPDGKIVGAGIADPGDIGANKVLLARFDYDVTPPDTSFLATPPQEDSNILPTFVITGNDGAGVGIEYFECNLDNEGWTACPSPYTVLGVGNGEHALQSRAVDGNGYADPTPVTYLWTIETLVLPANSMVERVKSFESAGILSLRTTITVPAGALNMTSTVEIGFTGVPTSELPPPPSGGKLLGGFEAQPLVHKKIPESLEFDAPVNMEIISNDFDIGDPRNVYCFHVDANGKWSRVGVETVTVEGKVINCTTNHFTVFGIIEVSGAEQEEQFLFVPAVKAPQPAPEE